MGVRSRVRRVLLVMGATAVLSVVGWSVLLASGVEALLRLPVGARSVLFGLIVCALLLAVWRFFRPAWGFEPSLVDVALRVERLRPAFRGRLASAYELERGVRGGGLEAALSAVAAKDAAEAVRSANVHGLVSSRVVHGPLGALVGAAVVFLGSGLIWPGGSATALERVLMPWTDASWPARFPVSDSTSTERHPMGSALAIRGVLLEARGALRDADVWVEYRAVLDSGERTRVRRELMTYQGMVEGSAGVSLASPDASLGGGGGAAFERLVEARGASIRYRLVTRDDATVWREVPLEQRPRIERASAVIQAPAYARVLGLDVGGGEVDLGRGDSASSVAPPSLEGSEVVLTVRLNKPATFGERADIGGVPLVQSDDDPSVYGARFSLLGDTRLLIDLVDAYGIVSEDAAVLRFPSLPDQVPGASVIQPEADEAVLASAVVGLIGEGRDDVALDRVTLSYRVASGGEETERVLLAENLESGERRLAADGELELGALGLAPGDSVFVNAVALDARQAAAGADGTLSSTRRLVVIDEERFVQQVQRALADVRQAAIRADAQQAQAQAASRESGPTRQSRRAQSQVGDRIDEQRGQLDDLSDRLERNRLGDARLEQLIEQAGASLDRAQQSSERAQAAMDAVASRVAEPEMPDGLTAEEREAIDEAQQSARDELSELVGLLDRGEDAWVVRNALQRALESQRELRERTREVGQDTVGRDSDELTDEQRAALEDIARLQQDLAEQTESALNQAEQRARELSDTDPTASIGLREAAQTAREQGVTRAMERAAQEAQQNQTANAEQAQQQAQEALEQAIEDLDAGERERDAVLRRALASVMESLQILIAQNEDVLAGLSVEEPVVERVLEGIVSLNTNTLAVTDLLRTGPEFQRVLSLVLSASDAQLGSGRALRLDPADVVLSRVGSDRSLGLLREALEAAQEADDDLAARELERKLAELRERYSAVLVEAVALVDGGRVFETKKVLSRRDRAEMRQLGGLAEGIDATLEQIESDVPEVLEARVFAYAHGQARRAAQRASDEFRVPSAERAVFHGVRLVRSLGEIVDSLGEPEPDDDPFDDGGQQDGGGGAGGAGGEQQEEQLVPPLKELRLLRRLQINLAEDTRLIDEAAGAEQSILDELAGMQRELAELGEDLVERMLDQGDLSGFFENGDGVRRGGVAPELEDGGEGAGS